MPAKILQFRLKDSPNRLQAFRWLKFNDIDFPNDIENNIGEELFHGWRFIKSTDGIIYFADCIHQGITKTEFTASDNQPLHDTH